MYRRGIGTAGQIHSPCSCIQLVTGKTVTFRVNRGACLTSLSKQLVAVANKQRTSMPVLTDKTVTFRKFFGML